MPKIVFVPKADVRKWFVHQSKIGAIFTLISRFNCVPNKNASRVINEVQFYIVHKIALKQADSRENDANSFIRFF